MNGDESGAKSQRFRTERAYVLDDAARFAYVPPESVVALLDVPPRGTVIDFGTGTGTYAIEVARRRPDVRVVAFDDEPAMLAKFAAKPEATAPNLVSATSTTIADYAGRADRILALNVLHELDDGALALLRSLLSPSGRALVLDWRAEGSRPVGPPPERVYDERAAEQRLRAVGFSVIALAEFPYHHAFVASLA